MKARLYCVLALATGVVSIDSAEVAANTALCGEAAWFDAGGLTASGEPSDADSLTAAHPDLPFGTRVEVDNLGNGRTAIVRINDRASFAKGRVILVSRAAAEKLGMIRDGTAQVRLNVLDGDGVRPATCQGDGNGALEAANAPLPSPNPVAISRPLREAASVAPEEQGSAPSEPDPLEFDAASPGSIVSRFAVAFQPESWQEAELAKVLAAVAPRLATPQTPSVRPGSIKRRVKIILPSNGLFPDFMGYLWSTEISMPHLARFEQTTSPGLLSQLTR